MTLFRFHDRDDRERSSDGSSRYGAYLRIHADLFTDFDDPVTAAPAHFARAAWQVATSPIMSPPYLDWTAERVQSVTFTGSEHDGSLIARIQVAVPRPETLRGLRGMADWDHGDRWRGPRGYHPPGDDTLARRPALLTSTLLLFQLPTADLYVPRDAPAEVSVRDAKHAAKRLAELVTAQLAPVLTALEPNPGTSGRTW